jgi:type IX secretion system PorP/SprF family membrane protein
MKKVIIYFVFLFLVAEVSFSQQDPQYSQYMFNQLVLNPAYAGSKEALSAVMDLRKQWVSMPGAPRTGTISMHAPLPFKSIGIGGHLINESMGPSKWTSASVDIAYRFKLGKGKLSLGISGGMINYNLSLSESDYKDGGEVFPAQNLGPRTRFDAGTGFYYYSPSFYIGGSITHINNPNLYSGTYTIPNGGTAGVPVNSTLFFSLKPHSFLYFGKGFVINQNLVINPSVIFKNDNATAVSSDWNCNFLIKQKFWLGLSLRSGYGAVFLFQYNVNDNFKVGYSFDQGFNRIGVVGQSSHEIMLGYNFSIYKSKMLSPRYL